MKLAGTNPFSCESPLEDALQQRLRPIKWRLSTFASLGLVCIKLIMRTVHFWDMLRYVSLNKLNSCDAEELSAFCNYYFLFFGCWRSTRAVNNKVMVLEDFPRAVHYRSTRLVFSDPYTPEVYFSKNTSCSL